MKPILIDFFRRWKRFYILAGAAQLIPGLVVPPFFSLYGTMFFGSFLIASDLMQGTARTIQTLPIKRKTLAAAWWILGVAVPASLFSIILAIVCVLRLRFNLGGPISFSQATLTATLSILWSGASYYLLTHISTAGPGGTSRSKKDYVVNGLWGASLAASVFLFMKLPDQWAALKPLHWLLLVIGTILTCLGWMRSEQMIIIRTASAQYSAHGHTSRELKKSRSLSLSGRGGLIGLFQTVTQTSLKSSGIFIFMFIALQVFLRRHTTDTIFTTIARIVRDPTTLYVLSFIIVLTGLQWLTAIRHLRSLPIKTTHLVLTIALLFIIPALFPIGALGIAGFLIKGDSSITEWGKLAALFGSVILVIPGLLLRFGLNRTSYFFTLVPLFILTPLVSPLVPRISIPISLLLCFAGWTAGAWLIYNALTVRSQTYRHLMTWPMRWGQ